MNVYLSKREMKRVFNVNFKLLVEKQTEIDTIYQKCNDLIQSTVTPKLDAEVEQF